MLRCDLADSSLAQCPPDAISESLGDLLREALSPHIPAPNQRQAFAAIDGALAEFEGGASGPGDSSPVRAVGIFEFVRAVYGDTRLPEEVRRRAAAVGIAIGDPTFDKPYQYYADYFSGVTRACIHADSREVQNGIGIHNRRDKSDSARQKSRLRASGPHRTTRHQRITSRRLFSFLPGL